MKTVHDRRKWIWRDGVYRYALPSHHRCVKDEIRKQIETQEIDETGVWNVNNGYREETAIEIEIEIEL